MKKIVGLSLLLAVGPYLAQNAHGAAAGLGFNILGNFYLPSDSRYQGIGTGVGINIKLDDSLTLGYRVEELNVRAEDSVAGVQVVDNHNLILQGITAYYRTWGAERLALDFGLWTGAATTADFNAAGVTGMTSPFVEPLGRVIYTTSGKVEAQAILGVGYRFIRRFNLADPFGAGAAAKRLNNFDGLDINFGVGVSF